MAQQKGVVFRKEDLQKKRHNAQGVAHATYIPTFQGEADKMPAHVSGSSPLESRWFEKQIPKVMRENNPEGKDYAAAAEDGITREEMIQRSESLSDQETGKVQGLVDNTTGVLFKMKTNRWFGLDPFPDEVIIDKNKISFIYRGFWGAERIQSVMLSNLSDVIVEANNPFFASLKIVDRGLAENQITMTHLKKEDAIYARRLIQGLMLSKLDAGVDFTKLSDEELVRQAEEAGRARQG